MMTSCAYTAAWEYKGAENGHGLHEVLNQEPLTFEYVHPSQRSYK